MKLKTDDSLLGSPFGSDAPPKMSSLRCPVPILMIGANISNTVATIIAKLISKLVLLKHVNSVVNRDVFFVDS